MTDTTIFALIAAIASPAFLAFGLYVGGRGERKRRREQRQAIASEFGVLSVRVATLWRPFGLPCFCDGAVIITAHRPTAERAARELARAFDRKVWREEGTRNAGVCNLSADDARRALRALGYEVSDA